MTIQDRVDAAVQENPHLSSRRMHVAMNEGCVTLRGVVGSYYQKQMAQESLRQIAGVQSIDNRLEVLTH